MIKVEWLLVAALVVVVIYALGFHCHLTCDNKPTQDNYQKYPTSYYDQGGWIDGPPQLMETIYHDPREPPTYGLK